MKEIGCLEKKAVEQEIVKEGNKKAEIDETVASDEK